MLIVWWLHHVYEKLADIHQILWSIKCSLEIHWALEEQRLIVPKIRWLIWDIRLFISEKKSSLWEVEMRELWNIANVYVLLGNLLENRNINSINDLKNARNVQAVMDTYYLQLLWHMSILINISKDPEIWYQKYWKTLPWSLFCIPSAFLNEYLVSRRIEFIGGTTLDRTFEFTTPSPQQQSE